MIVLNRIFLFHYQLNQNTDCNVKFVVSMNSQPKRLTNRIQSEQPFYFPDFTSWVTSLMMPC